MKDLFVTLVECIFESGNNEEFTLKKLMILVFKIIVFISIISLGIWVAIKLKK